MQYDFTKLGLFRRPTTPVLRQSSLAIEVSDLGFNDGIDVVVYQESSGRVLFETVLADPASRTLLTFGNPQTEAFWDCLDAHECLQTDQRLYLAARSHFSPLTPVVSVSRIGQMERRNACFLRLIEELLDEFCTRAPRVQVEVNLTHRNPAFESCINYPW